MTVIGLFFPSFISMAVYNRISGVSICKWENIIMRYGVYTLFNVLAVQITITYILGIPMVAESALSSFPFFIKYVLIAIIWAIVMPLMEELIRKYISASIKISTGKENEQDEKK